MKSSTFTGDINMKELQIKYLKGSGPGGQNINKVNTKVQIKFNIDNISWLNSETKELLKKYEPSKINRLNEFIINSNRTRYQTLNLADCLQKIRETIIKIENQEKYKKMKAEENVQIEEKRNRMRKEKAFQRILYKKNRSILKESRQEN
ncbi:hypothetical protein SNEBB_004112 [Seison nebaliae]|nr:hypothetical protein SNEBB_004112 [Seison nebaliae]